MSPKPQTSESFRLRKYRNERRAWLLLMDAFKTCGVWSDDRNRKCGARAIGVGAYMRMDNTIVGFCKHHEGSVARSVMRRLGE